MQARTFEGFSVGKNGRLTIGGCDAVLLAQRFATPLYVFDETRLRANCRDYREAFRLNYPSESRIAYAAKAFLTLAMAKLIKEEGLSLDVASAGELFTAMSARFPAGRIYMHGNCKTQEEMTMALRYGVHRLIIDSEQELIQLNRIAAKMGKKADIFLRITPGVEAHTHEYIKTGHLDTKFGIHIESGLALKAVKSALALKNINLHGIHAHIGSQIFDLESYQVMIEMVFAFLKDVRSKTKKVFGELDFGGGLGIRYSQEQHPPSVADYARVISRTLGQISHDLDYPLPQIIVEPGRSIVAEAGVTLYTIHYVKKIPGGKSYVIVDGGLSDNPRPALYGARYRVAVANKMNKPANFPCTVSGKHCETDRLFQDVNIQTPQRGDIMAVFSTGAYNYSMASNYNRYPRPAAIMAANGKARLIVRRESLGDLLRQDL
ncbi:MAG: diaminopimelate decarboxylase [Elusimicrobia bacterium]|nr:diaminopimelate decarboxylase [Elusimicrobiota bacterium]